MVDVVVAAVDVGQSLYGCATRGPHLCHVGYVLGHGFVVELVPKHHFAAQRVAHEVGHLLEEAVLDGHFVAAYVYVRGFWKYLGGLFEYDFQSLFALVGLHVEAHGVLEHVAVARHVNFGYDGDAALGSISLHLLALLLGVVLAGVAHTIGVAGELRVGFYLETPAYLFGQMPVKHVHLETGVEVDLLFQLVDRQE